MRRATGCLLAAAVLAVLIPSVARAQMGGPTMGQVTDAGNGFAHMTWSGGGMMAPRQYGACAWDLYDGSWTPVGPNNGAWCYFAPTDQNGDVNLHHSGAYHMWIGGDYSGMMSMCNNPWTGIQHSGPPHTPSGVWAEDLGNHRVRMHWNPDVYGTWHYQMIGYHMGNGWTQSQGPSGMGMWQFVDYGGAAYNHSMANFMQGWADFVMPSGGQYTMFMRGMGWDGTSAGQFSMASVSVAP